MSHSLRRLPSLLLGFFTLTNWASPGEPPAMPMPVVQSNTATDRWLRKPVLVTRLLDDMERTNRWSHRGQGKMSFTTARSRAGRRSVRLVSATKTERANPTVGRPFGEAAVRCNFDGEDWREFNRLSVWVYPTLPGFLHPSILIKLNNAGAERVPDRYGREGLHYVLLQNTQWNQVVFEIPHLARDHVTGVDLIYRLQGHEPSATNVVCFDFDQLELQRVEPDYFEGWQVAPGRIAYSHTGYELAATKTALVRAPAATEFVVREAGGTEVLRRPLRLLKTALGDFHLLDFSALRVPGQYRLQVSNVVTEPFSIGSNVWRETVWKTVNFFYGERCGDAVPGIHEVCHRDWYARHGQQRVLINGGWHDAGDLSQGVVNTAEAVQAMLELAEATAPTDPPLARRLKQEAIWGLEWVLKTRFGDGARVTWATMDFWTDGVAGNADDVAGEVRNGSFDNFIGASSEAVAARVLQPEHPALSARCLEAASQDWHFAVERMQAPGLELAAAALGASVELFKLTREQKYADQAFQCARLVQQCQQQDEPAWEVPLTGFFYTSPKRDRLLHYAHRGHEQAPTAGLAELCRLFPRHPDWMRWYSTLVLHSQYLSDAARHTEPWNMLSASIYSLDESGDATFRAQVRNGVPLDATHYLRRFPVWFDFRGNHGTVLSQTKAVAVAARLRGNRALYELGQRQLEWVVGRNPFARSTLFGEGHDYLPQYTPMSGDLVGSLPVGIQTRASEDTPYWPAANCYNYAEVWVHPSSRWLSIQRELIEGQARPAPQRGWELRPEQRGATGFTLRAVASPGAEPVALRTHNLSVKELAPEAADQRRWECAAQRSGPWIAVLVDENQGAVRAEAVGR